MFSQVIGILSLVYIFYLMTRIKEVEREIGGIKKDVAEVLELVKQIDATVDRTQAHLYEVAPSEKMLRWERSLEKPL